MPLSRAAPILLLLSILGAAPAHADDWATARRQRAETAFAAGEAAAAHLAWVGDEVERLYGVTLALRPAAGLDKAVPALQALLREADPRVSGQGTILAAERLAPALRAQLASHAAAWHRRYGG